MAYTVTYGEQSFELEPNGCSFFLNDEEKPIAGIDPALILNELAGSDLVEFHKEYYDQACEACHKNRKEGGKYFEFLECHFYLFSKEGIYVMSSLSEAYANKTLPDLLEAGSVDGSYIVSINVCAHCGDYTIDLEYGLW